MPLRTRVWTAGKLVVLAGSLAATFLLFAAVSMRLALKTREVQVPDLRDKTPTEASAMASDRGLALRVDDTRRPDPKIAPGRVLGQDPPQGSIARRQRSVKIWLSAGPRVVTVPALLGETERTAQLKLSQYGLELAGVAEIRSPDYPADVVVAQTPTPKTASERVALLVNRGSKAASYVMPDLIGVNGDRAAELLRARGFRVGLTGSAPYPGVAAGTIVRQSPPAGFQIAPSEPVSLEVSR
jgi:serine/threonine-protein kinase